MRSLLLLVRQPLAVREMAKETEDLQRLKEVEMLDRELLEWLRTSDERDPAGGIFSEVIREYQMRYRK